MLQIRFAGSAPDVGEYHYAFPSDCLPWSTRAGSFVVEAPPPQEDAPTACAALAEERSRLGRSFATGDRSGHARWFTGRPARVMAGGVGGNRVPLIVPEPAALATWLSVASNLRNVNLASLDEVDKLGDPSESLAQRAKQASAGGAMVVYLSKNSRQGSAKEMWSPKTIRDRNVGPLVDGMIAEAE